MLTELGDEVDLEKISAITESGQLLFFRQEIRKVFVSESVKQYIVALVQRTRNHPLLKAGASPRASRSLYQGGKSLAAMSGRTYVTPDDIREIFLPVTCHRIILSGDAKYTGKTPEQILTEILEEEAVPPFREDLFQQE